MMRFITVSLVITVLLLLGTVGSTNTLPAGASPEEDCPRCLPVSPYSPVALVPGMVGITEDKRPTRRRQPERKGAKVPFPYYT